MKTYTDEEIRRLIEEGDLWQWEVDALSNLERQTNDEELRRRIRDYRVSANHREEGLAGIL